MLRMDIRKRFVQEDNEFYLNINLDSGEDENLFLIGDSGSGKTTVLNILAGIIEPDFAEIVWKDKIWYSSLKKKNTKIQNRDISYFFQDYRLFKNMTVEENIYYGMKKRDMNFYNKLLEIMDIGLYSKSSIDKLSGGQKQRVALARAIAKRPKILLLDEPFSALDFSLKSDLIKSIERLKDEFGFKLIMVSHDLRDIIKFSGKVVYMEKGRIKKIEEFRKNCKKADCFLEKWFTSVKE